MYGLLSNTELKKKITLAQIPSDDFCYRRSFFDPTCGAGEFLLSALHLKIEVLLLHAPVVPPEKIRKVVSTIYGNDLNPDSVFIVKLRLFLYVIERFGADYARGLFKVLNSCITTMNFITEYEKFTAKHDIIVGNPPYVEDAKSGIELSKKYGNIYANILENSAMLLKNNGTMGFVVPLSYISTTRMKKIRQLTLKYLSTQYVLSYADRPDCLFNSVHQKLNILIGKHGSKSPTVFTSSYRYWYKEERDTLFDKVDIVENPFLNGSVIPKLGSKIDLDVFRKIMSLGNDSQVYKLSRSGSYSVYLNRRETFWMKAFRTKINDPEYKIFSFNTQGEADFCYCLINSSLFWWYWIAVSDCWHVSKDLNGFTMPTDFSCTLATKLATGLEAELERTKIYVGTKQVDYEYKHRSCLKKIHAIDDFVNPLYGLTDIESQYIKSFSLRYRISGGPNA